MHQKRRALSRYDQEHDFAENYTKASTLTHQHHTGNSLPHLTTLVTQTSTSRFSFPSSRLLKQKLRLLIAPLSIILTAAILLFGVKMLLHKNGPETISKECFDFAKTLISHIKFFSRTASINTVNLFSFMNVTAITIKEHLNFKSASMSSLNILTITVDITDDEYSLNYRTNMFSTLISGTVIIETSIGETVLEVLVDREKQKIILGGSKFGDFPNFRVKTITGLEDHHQLEKLSGAILRDRFRVINIFQTYRIELMGEALAELPQHLLQSKCLSHW